MHRLKQVQHRQEAKVQEHHILIAPDRLAPSEINEFFKLYSIRTQTSKVHDI
jgi:hypothetical protein